MLHSLLTKFFEIFTFFPSFWPFFWSTGCPWQTVTFCDFMVSKITKTDPHKCPLAYPSNSPLRIGTHRLFGGLKASPLADTFWLFWTLKSRNMTEAVTDIRWRTHWRITAFCPVCSIRWRILRPLTSVDVLTDGHVDWPRIRLRIGWRICWVTPNPPTDRFTDMSTDMLSNTESVDGHVDGYVDGYRIHR